MNCTNCEGSGLESSYKVCPVCSGLGYTGEKAEEVVEAPVAAQSKKTMKSMVKKALSKKK